MGPAYKCLEWIPKLTGIALGPAKATYITGIGVICAAH